jgi:hypothetical protein
MKKPVIRMRCGKWFCRGNGHQGSGRTIGAAYCAWRHVVTLDNRVQRIVTATQEAARQMGFQK